MKNAVVLLADSQLLFPGVYSQVLLSFFKHRLASTTGVYIGAANNDEPLFYELARDAFAALGACLEWAKQVSLDACDHYAFFVLAGGDVELGWRYLSQRPVAAGLQSAHQRGALFIGVSAGAMHLGHAIEPTLPRLQGFLSWFDGAVAVHEERENWPTRSLWQKHFKDKTALLCVPYGGGAINIEGHWYQTGKGAHYYPLGEDRIELPLLKPWDA